MKRGLTGHYVPVSSTAGKCLADRSGPPKQPFRLGGEARIVAFSNNAKAALVLLVWAALVASCASRPPRDVGEMTAVAIIDGTDEAAERIVCSTLREHGIFCYAEGSLAHAVMVPKNRLNAAKKVLLKIPESNRPWIILLENGRLPAQLTAPKHD